MRLPCYGEYPQWTAEPLPATRTNQNLAVELREFKTGMRMTGRRGQGDEAIAARATRVVFAFAEHGKLTEDFRVREIAISDATGNNWRPSLDLTGQDWNWATNGTAHFFGNLWPTENAWKLRVEVIRDSGFPPEDQWELSLRLPMRGELYALTNRWQHNDEAVQLVALGSPKAEHTGAFKPLGSWWYDGRNEVYSLALSAIPATEDQIVTMVRGVDQNGEEVKSVGQSTVLPTGERVLFFKPETSAIDIKLTLALQRSHFVEFLARPEFLNTVTNSAK